MAVSGHRVFSYRNEKGDDDSVHRDDHQKRPAVLIYWISMAAAYTTVKNRPQRIWPSTPTEHRKHLVVKELGRHRIRIHPNGGAPVPAGRRSGAAAHASGVASPPACVAPPNSGRPAGNRGASSRTGSSWSRPAACLRTPTSRPSHRRWPSSASVTVHGGRRSPRRATRAWGIRVPRP